MSGLQNMVDSGNWLGGNIGKFSPICSHEHFDIPSRVESIQLVDQLQHGPLHFIIATRTVVESCSADSVDFVKEDDTSFLAPGHFEEFADETSTFTDVFLHKF